MIVCPYKDLNRYAAVIPGLEEALAAIDAMTEWKTGTIPLSGGNRIMVQEYTSTSAEGKLAEAHRKFLDIQYIVEGEEYVGWAPLDSLTLDGSFSDEKDVGMYAGHVDYMRIGAGYCYVVFPEDAHAPGAYLEQPCAVRKIVVKLAV